MILPQAERRRRFAQKLAVGSEGSLSLLVLTCKKSWDFYGKIIMDKKEPIIEGIRVGQLQSVNDEISSNTSLTYIDLTYPDLLVGLELSYF